jgi:hypothetical protein
VATNGAGTGDGSASRPFRTISRAAELARPGDTVIVYAGEYREWVRPRCGGLSDARRITHEAAPGGDHQRFPGVKQPAYLRDNVYAPGARAFADETSALTLAEDVSFEVTDEGDEVYLEAQLPEAFGRVRLGVVTGADLPRVRFADADFEERDGSPVVVDVDLLGERKEPGHAYPAGPIASLGPGTSRIRVC